MNIVVVLWILIVLLIIERIALCAKEVLRMNDLDGCAVANIISIREDVRYRYFHKIYNYYPTFQYMSEGMIYEGESFWAYKASDNKKVGDKAVLYYDRDEPENFVTFEQERHWRNSTVIWIVILEMFLLFTIYCWGRPLHTI